MNAPAQVRGLGLTLQGPASGRNTTVLSGDVAAAIRRAERPGPGGELEVRGSGALVRWLLGDRPGRQEIVPAHHTPWSWGRARGCSPPAGAGYQRLELVGSLADRPLGGVTLDVVPPERAPGVRNGMDVRNVRWVGVATPRYRETTKLFREVMGLRVSFEEPTTVAFSTSEGDAVQDSMAPGDSVFRLLPRARSSARSRSSRWTTCSPRGPNWRDAGIDVVGELGRDARWGWVLTSARPMGTSSSWPVAPD